MEKKANKNAGFQSPDNKKQEDGGHFHCFGMWHNADKQYLLTIYILCITANFGHVFFWHLISYLNQLSRIQGYF